jgi:HK97 family phage major capsid protein
MPEIVYKETEREKELRKALAVKQAEWEALMKELDDPKNSADGTKAAEARAKLTEVQALRERLALEVEGNKERAWANASQREPTRPVDAGPEASFARTTPADRRFAGGLPEYLAAVIRAAAMPDKRDPRLQWDEWEVRAPSGASSLIPSEGGFLMQPEDAGLLLRDAFTPDTIVSKARRVRLGAGSSGVTFKLIDETTRADGVRHGGMRVYRAVEGETVTASKIKWRTIKLDLEDMMGISYLTNRMMQDPVGLANFVQGEWVKELKFQMAKEMFEGTGVGMALGFTKSGALIAIAKEGSQATYTINVMNVLKMWAQMWNPGLATAVWACNQDTLPQLLSLNSDPAVTKLGYPLFLPPGATPMAGSPLSNGVLLGSPLIRSEFCESIGLQNDIMYIDPAEYLIIDKDEAAFDSSVHVRFLYNEMTLRLTYAWNGMPLWDTYMTPYKGSNYVSPFITLAVRTS